MCDNADKQHGNVRRNNRKQGFVTPERCSCVNRGCMKREALLCVSYTFNKLVWELWLCLQAAVWPWRYFIHDISPRRISRSANRRPQTITSRPSSTGWQIGFGWERDVTTHNPAFDSSYIINEWQVFLPIISESHVSSSNHSAPLGNRRTPASRVDRLLLWCHRFQLPAASSSGYHNVSSYRYLCVLYNRRFHWKYINVSVVCSSVAS